MKKKAELVQSDRVELATGFVDILVWRVPQPVPGSNHNFKYSLAYVADDVCILRYDNETNKGDHKHVGGLEMAYRFVSLNKLTDDFLADVTRLGG